jgi:hypothetical protein
MSYVETIEAKYRVLAGRLDEATLRLWAAVEARSLGRGGVSTVAKAIGMSRTTEIAGWMMPWSRPTIARKCLTQRTDNGVSERAR